MPISRDKKYALQNAPFYKLSNKKRLSDLLDFSVKSLEDLEAAGICTQYRIFKDKKTDRFINEPIDQLFEIHQKIFKLFSRIIPPDYAHSAIKKRSYMTNAIAHKGAEGIIKIDIKKFFPSVSFDKIYSFFRYRMLCSEDISTILAKLCTVKTNKFGVHLPTGSCISPILSLFVNLDMFDKIDALSKSHGCTMTVYVDDITISGASSGKNLLNEVSRIIHNYGYKYHKMKVYGNEPALVTGLILSGQKVSVPHDRLRKIRALKSSIRIISDFKVQEKILASLVGRLSEVEQLNPFFKGVRLKVMQDYGHVWKRVVDFRTAAALRSRQLAQKKLKQASTEK